MEKGEYNKDKLAVLVKWVDAKSKVELDGGAEDFMGLPDRWYERPTFRCCNGHVSLRYLKCERLGYNACLECMEPVVLTFPEDKESHEKPS